ncbi:MAG: phosphatidylserine decarboxylase family protein [Deltaproteobacteria bacterium]|nr:phosphatidylserine decarboxylase family protein [Deltaproteobacteria bacterium]
MQNNAFLIAQEGFKFILVGFVLSLLGWFFLGSWAGIIFILITVAIALFFRNPHREPSQEKNIILSPADGKICMMTEAYEHKFLKEPRKRISIFMSIFNCHVNRSPIAATIADVHYHPGKFHLAHLDKASDLNEQRASLLVDCQERKLVMVQIAGWVARRIVSYVNHGDTLALGQRVGIIQFGSRVDVYLPKETTVEIQVGQKVKAGKSILARFV